MLQNKNYNIIPFIGLILTVFTMLWFAFGKIDTGFTYIMLFLVPIALLFSLYLFIDEQSKSSVLAKLKEPFGTSSVAGAVMVFVGWGLYIFINSIGKLFSSAFSITSFMIPLAASKVNVAIQQSATQLSIASSTATQLFVTVFVASFIEEFIFRFVLIYVFFALVYLILKAINPTSKPNYYVTLVLAFIFTAASFAFVHQLNGSYTNPTMYVVAAAFAILMAASVYLAGLMLSFVIGFHQANNFFWFAQTYGWSTTLKALVSWQGLVMGLYFVLLLIIILNNVKPAQHFFSGLLKNLKRGKSIN